MLALAVAIGPVLDTSAVDADAPIGPVLDTPPIGPGSDTSVDGASGSVKGVSGSGNELLGPYDGSLELV